MRHTIARNRLSSRILVAFVLSACCCALNVPGQSESCYNLIGSGSRPPPTPHEAAKCNAHSTERFQLRFVRDHTHRSGDVASVLSAQLKDAWLEACGGDDVAVGRLHHNATHVGASSIAVVAPYAVLMRALTRMGDRTATMTTLCHVHAVHVRAPLVLSIAAGGGLPLLPRSCLAVSMLPSTTAVSGMHTMVLAWIQDGSLSDRFDIVEDTGSVLVCCTQSAPCAFPTTVLDAIVQTPTVLHTAVMEPPVLHLNYSRGLLASGVSHVEPFADALGLTGAGYVVGITDTGIDADHCFFRDDAHDVPYDTYNGDHRKIVRYQSYATDSNARGDFTPGHGTHVAATVVGSVASSSGSDAAVQPFHGVVPDAKVSFVDLSGSLSEGIQTKSLEGLARIVSNDGATVMTNSWGGGLALYNAACASIDRFVYEMKRSLVVLFSAGNEADFVCQKLPLLPLCDRFTVMAASTAKNVISVGASQATQASWVHADLGNYLFVADNGTVNGTLRDFALKGVAGPAFPPPINARLLMADPPDLCTPVRGNAKGAILVAHRGTCTFLDKTQAAIAGGAVALVVVNNCPGHGIIMGCPDVACSAVAINAFMVSQSFGAMLAAVLPLSSSSTGAPGWTGSIGATSLPMEDRNEGTLSSFSSHGPTADLRYKPDLVAVGEMLHSARSDGNLHSDNCDLWASQGTSMSCPLVAGLAVMVQEYLARIHTPHLLAPSAALVKAILIQAAKPLSGRYERNFQGDWRPLGDTPNFEEGHGFPILNSTLPMRPDGGDDIRIVLKDEVELLPGAVHRYCIDFRSTDHQPAFEATLVWIDPPGSSSVVHQQLVNNLDLRVAYQRNATTATSNASSSARWSGDSSRMRYGNARRDVVFEAVAGSTPDVVNNVEKVRIQGSTSGREFVVEVLGTRVATNAQPYALVVSGTEVPCATVIECPTSFPIAANGSAGGVAAPCGGRGTCEAGACRCDIGWTGMACATPMATLSLHETAHMLVHPMAWAMLRIDTPSTPTTQPFAVRIVHSNPMADVDIAICKEALPTLAVLTDPAEAASSTCVAVNRDRDNANELPSPNSAAASAFRVDRVLSFAAEPATTYVVGIHGMCCYPVNVSITVDDGATLAPAIGGGPPSQDDRRSIDVGAVAGAHRAIAFDAVMTNVGSETPVLAQLRHKRTFQLLASGPCAAAMDGTSSWCNVSTLVGRAPLISDDDDEDSMLVFAAATSGGALRAIGIPHPSLYRVLRTQEQPPQHDDTSSSNSSGSTGCDAGGCAGPAPSAADIPPQTRNYSHTFRFSGRMANCVPNSTVEVSADDAEPHCHMHTTAVLPNTATGESFYSEDPPLLPSIVLVLDARSISVVPRSAWVDLSTVDIRAKAVDANGIARTGVDAWSLTLDTCTAMADAFVIVCRNVSGLQAGAMYRMDVVPTLGSTVGVPAVLRFHPNLTLWVSHYPTISSLSLERFTRYANPLRVAFPVLNNANTSLFLQGNFLLPEVPRNTAGDDDNAQDRERFEQLDALSISFSSVTGMFDDLVCDRSIILTSSTMQCTLAAFPVVPEGTVFLVQVRSTTWYAMVTGYVQLVLDPRPRIQGMVDGSSSIGGPSTPRLGNIRIDGTLTLVGTAFPVGGTSATLGAVTLCSASLTIRMVTQFQNASCIVVAVPVEEYLDASGPFAAGVGGGSSADHIYNLTSTFDVDVPLQISVDSATPDGTGGFVAIDGVALATQTMLDVVPNPAVVLGETLVCNPKPASYLWISGRQLQLANGTDHNGLRVYLVPERSPSNSAVDDMRSDCVVKPWLSRMVGQGHLVCRLSPYLKWNQSYRLDVRLGKSVASIPNRLSVMLKGSNEPLGVTDVATMNLEGVPMQLGATTYFTIAAAGVSSSVMLVDRTVSDCSAPVPLEGMEVVRVGSGVSEDHPDVVLTTFAATPVLLPTTGGGNVQVCFSNGTVAPGLTAPTYVDAGDAFYIPLDPMLWQVPSIVAVSNVATNQTLDGSNDAIVTTVAIHDSWSTGVVDLAAPLTLTVTIGPFVWVQSATLDEEAQPFFVYLGAEDVSHEATAAASHPQLNQWRGCNASRVVVFGQPDAISSDNRVFTFEGINILRDVLRYRGGSLQPTAVRLCLELATSEATAELMPTTHFAQIFELRDKHANAPPSSAAPPVTTATTSMAPTTTTAQPTSTVPTCSCNHLGGTCLQGVCVCDAAFRGATCDRLCPAAPLGALTEGPLSVCSGRGQCLLAPSQQSTTCRCDEGFDGSACQTVVHELAKPPMQLALQDIASEAMVWSALSLRGDGRLVSVRIVGAAAVHVGNDSGATWVPWGLAMRSSAPRASSCAAASIMMYNASTRVKIGSVHGILTAPSDANTTALVGPLGVVSVRSDEGVVVLMAIVLPRLEAEAPMEQCHIAVAAVAFDPLRTHEHPQTLAPAVVYRTVVDGTLQSLHEGCVSTACYVVYTTVGSIAMLCTVLAIVLGVRYRYRVSLIEWR